MMKKILKIASTVSFCSALMMLSPTSEASIINYSYTFNSVADSGDLITYPLSNGSFAFSYDDTAGSLSSSSGTLNIALSAISFDFNSKTYNLTTTFLTSTPTADFIDGAFVGVSYVSETLPNQTTVALNDKYDPWAAYFNYDQYDSSSTLTGLSGYGDILYTDTTPVAHSAVPLPAAIWLFGSGLAGFGVVSRRKRQLAL